MVTSIGHWVEQTDFTALAQRLLDSANELLARVPFMDITLTPDSVRDAATNVGQNVGQIALGFARDSVGGLAATLTGAIIFLYVFVALLTNGDKVLACSGT